MPTRRALKVPAGALLASFLLLAGTTPTELIVEDIELQGVRPTRRPAIMAMISVEAGAPLDEAQVNESRLRLLETGLFGDVKPRLKRGRAAGRVILVFDCEERETASLDAFHLGSGRPTPIWMGAELSDLDPTGLGFSTSAGLVFSERQWGTQATLGFPFPFQTGGATLQLGGHYTDGMEPFVGPKGQQLDRVDQSHIDLPYRRAGGQVGLVLKLSALTQITATTRLEDIFASRPDEARQLDPDGVARPFDFAIDEGHSLLNVWTVGVAQDARDDPSHPTRGHRLELSTRLGMGSYPFVGFIAGYQQSGMPWLDHVLTFHLRAGLILGEAPFFEQFFVGDLHPYVPDRALGMNFARRRGPFLLDGTLDEARYESAAAHSGLEYRLPLGGGRYRTEIFLAGVVIGLQSPEELGKFPRKEQPFPLDAAVDFGLRIQSDIGLLGVSVSNLFQVVDP